MTPTRRTVLKSIGLASVVGASGAAGCSAGTQSSGTPAATATSVAKSDVPVGSAVVVPGSRFIVTQPSAGTYKAFLTVCPHAGCDVTGVKGDRLVCPCHGSTFAVSDGSVLVGPAKTGLTPATVRPEGDTLNVST